VYDYQWEERWTCNAGYMTIALQSAVDLARNAAAREKPLSTSLHRRDDRRRAVVRRSRQEDGAGSGRRFGGGGCVRARRIFAPIYSRQDAQEGPLAFSG